SATINTVSINPSFSDSYTVSSVTGECAAIDTFKVTVNPILSISGPTTAVCPGSGVILIGSGASTYTWSTNAGGATTNTVSVNPTSNTVYTLTGSMAGCTSTQTISVTTLSLTIYGTTNIPCAGNTTTLTASGGTTSYTWSAN